MVSEAIGGIGDYKYHRLCHEKIVLGAARGCQTMQGLDTKKPVLTGSYRRFCAGRCLPMPNAGSFPLNRAGRLARDVVRYPVDATNFVDNTISDAREKGHVKWEDISRHSVCARDST